MARRETHAMLLEAWLFHPVAGVSSLFPVPCLHGRHLSLRLGFASGSLRSLDSMTPSPFLG